VGLEKDGKKIAWVVWEKFMNPKRKEV